MFEEEEDEMAPSVIKDLLDQVTEISRRQLEIRIKSDEDPKIPPIPLKEYDPISYSYRIMNHTIQSYLIKLKKKLLVLQDNIKDKKREKENREKILFTEGLELGRGRLKLLDLENRSLILPYQDRYVHVRDKMKRRRIPDWRNHLLIMCKESLKMKQVLLSRLFNKSKPITYEDSINGLKILKRKKLEKNLSDIQLEMVITQALLPTCQSEFFRKWAKEKSTTALSSTMLGGVGISGIDDEEEEALVDFDKTIADKLDTRAKREFLEKFLSRKLIELNEIMSSRRTRNFGKKETIGLVKYVKFKDRTFQMVECPDDVQIDEEVTDEKMFLSKINETPKSNNLKKNFPIKCGRQHTNGSLFFCPQFRKKEVERKKSNTK